MHKTMVSVVSLEKIEKIRSQEFMPNEARLKFLKKMIILWPKTAILGPQFCRILVLGPHFWWSGGPPGSAPVFMRFTTTIVVCPLCVAVSIVIIIVSCQCELFSEVYGHFVKT